MTEFEEKLLKLLREKGIIKIDYPGSLTIHYDKDLNPVSIEIREIIK